MEAERLSMRGEQNAGRTPDEFDIQVRMLFQRMDVIAGEKMLPAVEDDIFEWDSSELGEGWI